MSFKETEEIGKILASKLNGNEVITLYGDLGAGKTTLTRGIASFFGVENEVSSPTFAIMNEYQSEKVNIYHFDMYRVNSIEELESTGFFEYLGKGLIIIEWSENIEKYLPKDIIKVSIEKLNEKEREIKVIGADIK